MRIYTANINDLTRITHEDIKNHTEKDLYVDYETYQRLSAALFKISEEGWGYTADGLIEIAGNALFDA